MAKRTLSQYPQEFLSIWELALAGTLRIEFEKYGTGVNLRTRLYTYRKRMDEEAPIMAQPFKVVDLVMNPLPNANGKYELTGQVLSWKRQAREQMSQLAAIKPAETPNPASQTQPRMVPAVPTPQAGAPEPEQDAMDSTLKSLGFGSKDGSNNS